MSSTPKPKKSHIFGKIQQKEKQVSYTWSIADFCNIRKQYSTEAFILSPVFYTDVESEWQLELYPQGHKDDDKEYISLFAFNRSGATIEAQITFSIIGDDAQAIDTTKIVNRREFENSRQAWGFPKFVSYNSIVKLLGNDNTLIIKCKIDLDNTSCIESHENEKQVHFQVRKYDNFEKLLDNNKFSDVILTAEGEKIHAHKNILAFNCEVFAAMFEHDMTEKEQNVVEMKDISANVLKEMLRYLYVGRVNNIIEIASDLLVAADRYLLKNLKNMCQESLCDNLSSSNVIEYLKFAENHNAPKLKAEAIQYVVSNAEKIIDDPEVQSYENLDSRVIWEIFHKLVVQRVDKKAK